MDLLKDAAEKLKNKISNSPLEKLLDEATSDVNWNASNKILQEIADHTYSFGDFTEVMKFIWKRLGSERKQWRKILKTLTLIEYLIKNGSPKCVQEFQREIYLIRTLQDFSHYEDGQDRGAAIRDVSKRTIQLLGDDAKIDEERKKAQEIRERLGTLGTAGSGANKYGGYSNKDSSTGSSSRNWNSSSTSTSSSDVRKTRDWRVQKTEEGSSKAEEKEEAYVEKTGTKYNTSNTREKEEQEAKAAEKKKLAPPKGMKAPVQQQQQQQQEVDFFGMDAPTSQPAPTQTQTSAPANNANNNNNNVDFGWDTPQTQPQVQTQSQPQQPQNNTNQNNANIWNWQQGQQGQPNNTQQTQPSGNQGVFNWNQAPTNQPVQPPVQNVYQQQPQNTQPVGGFGFNNAPQNNNMNNLTSQLNSVSFNTPSTTGGNFGFNNNTQSPQPVNVTGFNTSPPKAPTDGFDDFVTAKSTAPITNEYKNYSQQEKSIIDLSDIADEASKKKTQKDKVEVVKNSNEGFIYSSKEDLDNFLLPSQPLNNLTNMGFANSNMGGGFNPGMMNPGMKNMQMGGMQPMGMGGMQPMGMGMQMGGGMNPMGGMQPMGMMNNGMGMQGMQMGGFQNMGMNANAGFNNMNMQGGFNPNMGGFGYR